MNRSRWTFWPGLLGVSLLAACGPEPREMPPAAVAAVDPEDPRIARVRDGLVPMTESAEPLWDQRVPLPDRLRHYRVPGVGVAVIEDFELVWAAGFGWLKAGGDARVMPDTLFHAGSIAKCLSATAVLGLVEEGVLDLDRDVNQDLRSWKIPDSDFTRDEKVTLRRLLSHSGGIRDGFSERSSADRRPDYFRPEGEEPSVTLVELLEGGPGVDVDRPTRVVDVPGSRFRYANADYAILELLVRDVTAEPYAAFMARSVLEPLGLTSSTYEQPLPPALRRRAAAEHDLRGRPLPGDRLHVPMLAAGGLWTTPSDLARFAVEILDAGRGEPARLLARATVEEMLTAQIAIPANPVSEAAGLGFELAGEGAGRYFVHTGGTWGSTAVLWAFPETGQGAVIMTNSASGSLLRFELLLAIAREYGWPLEG